MSFWHLIPPLVPRLTNPYVALGPQRLLEKAVSERPPLKRGGPERLPEFAERFTSCQQQSGMADIKEFSA